MANRKKHPPTLEDSELKDTPKPILDFEDLRRLAEEVGFASDQTDYGDTRESDARQAGYLDTENRKDHHRDRRDDEGHGTGAYTDVGRGRSAAIRSMKSRKEKTMVQKQSHTDAPQQQYPGFHGSIDQAQEFINEYGPKDDPVEGARDLKILDANDPSVQRKRADVPVGPSEHDKLVPPDVAQGD